MIKTDQNKFLQWKQVLVLMKMILINQFMFIYYPKIILPLQVEAAQKDYQWQNPGEVTEYYTCL